MKNPRPDAPATIDVFALARSHERIEGCIAVAAMKRLAPLLSATDGEVSWHLEGATDRRGRPAMTVSVRGSLTVNCDRCGEKLELPVATESQFWFVRTEEELNLQPIGIEDSEPLIGGRQFVIADLIEDEAILALPISPHHAHCRVADEPAEDADRRRSFSALATLKSRH